MPDIMYRCGEEKTSGKGARCKGGGFVIMVVAVVG